MATPLHNHTHYSALDGMATPADIASRVADLGYGAVACTDHDLVSGHVDFYKTISDAGIKPILGIETYQTFNRFEKRDQKQDDWKNDNFHLILLAKNDTGLRNLWALNTMAHQEGFYYHGRTDWDLLKQYSEGLIATSACGLSLLGQSVQGNPNVPEPHELMGRYLDIFGEDFYVELTTYPGEWAENMNVELAGQALIHGVPVVYANDAHYAFPEQYDLHEVVLCMQMLEKEKDRTEPHHSPDLYIMDEEDVRDHLSYLGQTVIDTAISSSDEIAKQCDVTLPEFKQRIPTFIPDKKYKNAKEMLYDLAVEGYEKKIIAYGRDSEEYIKRFEEEIRVIYDANLVDYFLIVRDFIYWAKSNGILVGPGRGSVGGSLVAWLLGITEIDPIRYGLMFERFYNAGREESLPDIDIDFPKSSRDKVKEYIEQTYGKEYVADIGNVLQLRGRAAIKKLGATMSVNMKDTEKISKRIETLIDAGLQPSWDTIITDSEIQKWEQVHPTLMDRAGKLYGHIFSYGVHASGILIGDEPLAHSFPLRWHSKEKKMVSQWDMRIAENLGFMKMDILALRNLDTLTELNSILKSEGKDPIDFEKLQYEDHPDEMWELIDQHQWTVGLFQIEDGGQAKSIAKGIRPRSIEELGLCVSINRPGPLGDKVHEKYVAARQNPDYAVYDHPILEEVLAETYGEFIYQEQVLAYFLKLGYSLQEADSLRAIIGKKKREDMKKEYPRYIKRATKMMDEDIADEIWNRIGRFAFYAFNKAHSISYGLILLWTLYAKWKYPKEFIVAGMRTVEKKDRYRYVQEAQRMGIQMLPVDIDKSQARTSFEDGAIRFGFSDVKHVGIGPARWLVENRPFKDYAEVREVRYEDDRKIMLPSGGRKVGINDRQIGVLEQLATMTDPDLLCELQEELIGVAISDESAKILEEYKEEIEEECTPLDMIDAPGEYNIAGIIREVRQTKTKNGKKMAWVKIENEGIEKEIAVWGNEFDRLNFIWRRRQAVVAQVKVSERGTSLKAAKALFSKRGDNIYAEAVRGT